MASSTVLTRKAVVKMILLRPFLCGRVWETPTQEESWNQTIDNIVSMTELGNGRTVSENNFNNIERTIWINRIALERMLTKR